MQLDPITATSFRRRHLRHSTQRSIELVPSKQGETHSARLKFELALEVLSGDRSIDEIAEDHDLADRTIRGWVEQLESSGHRVFGSNNGSEPLLAFDDRIETYINSVPEMVLALDEAGTILRANENLLDKLGYRKGDLEGRSYPELLAASTLDDLIDRKPDEHRTHLENRRGETVPVSLSVSAVNGPDGSRYHLCFARDIADLKQARKKLKAEKDRFRSLYDQAPVGLWEQDMSETRRRVEAMMAEGVDDLDAYLRDHPDELRDLAADIKTLSVNEQLLDILGARNKDHLLENLNNVFTEDTYEVFRDELVTFFEEGENSYRSEVNVQTVNGEPRTVLFSLNHPETLADDWSWVFVTYRDITERKRVQEELAKNEERFRQLAENIESVFWIQSLESGENLYVSPAVEEITGRSRRVFIRNPEAFLDIVHPEDADRVEEAFRRGKRHNFLPPGDYEEEYRILTPDGDVRWLHDRAFPVRNDDGTIYRVAGIAEDITERKRMERQLAESLEEKDTLLREVHHRVKNNMQIISSLLRLQSYQIEDEEIRQHFLDCQQRVRSMVMVHERLYQSESLSDLDVPEYLRQLVEGLINSYSLSRDPELDFDVDDDMNLDLDHTIACGLIINEIVSNSLEHAFGDSVENPRIELSLKRHQQRAHLRVADNGNPPPGGLSVSESSNLGLQLLESITSTQLNGDYKIETNGGTVIEVTFPITEGGESKP